MPKIGTLLIGRTSTNQIQLTDQSVSRFHASLIVTRRGIYIQDEGSSSGTLLNGHPIPAKIPVTLKPSDVLQFGHYDVFEYKKQG
jgi:pSer/pThr/pTyr-binding forkhead associated (FHA) protein